MAWWLKWHRRLGLVILLLVVMLAVSGILINHSQSMGWHHKPVYSHWLAHLYGIPPSEAKQGFPVAGRWVSQLDNTIYLNEQVLVECNATLVGALLADELLTLLCGDSLWLFEMNGELVEQVRGAPLNALRLGVDSLSESADFLWLESPTTTMRFAGDTASWHKAVPDQAIHWLTPRDLPEPLIAVLNRQAPIPGLNRERVLLDIHSGRILGEAGVWIVDAAAVVMMILACSGFITWFSRYRKKNKRNLKR